MMNMMPLPFKMKQIRYITAYLVDLPPEVGKESFQLVRTSSAIPLTALYEICYGIGRRLSRTMLRRREIHGAGANQERF